MKVSKTKIWTTIPLSIQKFFNELSSFFWDVLLIWTFFCVWAAPDMAILQRRLQPALQRYNKWFFERRRGSYRIEPNHWKALAIASESAGTPDHLGAYFMCDCHQGQHNAAASDALLPSPILEPFCPGKEDTWENEWKEWLGKGKFVHMEGTWSQRSIDAPKHEVQENRANESALKKGLHMNWKQWLGLHMMYGLR